MALMKKQDSNKKKETSKKEASKKAVIIKDKNVIVKDKKTLVKKDSSKVVVRKDKVNRLEQVKKFFRGALGELKKVHWLNSREVVIYTSVVLVAVVIVGCMIWLFDSILSLVLRLVMQR